MSKAHSQDAQFSKAGENLYRYSSNGNYYAVFRDKGKLKYKSLKTNDRAMAKRRLMCVGMTNISPASESKNGLCK
jgi:hypothetical protein